MLAQFGEPVQTTPAVARAADYYLRCIKLAEGSWHDRWGTTYIYGAWSVLFALNPAGVDCDEAESKYRLCDRRLPNFKFRARSST